MTETTSFLKRKWNRFHDKLRGHITNFLHNKLAMQWVWLMAGWLAIWAVLIHVARDFWLVTWIGVGLLAVHITRWIHQALLKAKPRMLISDTKNKAVLITGCDTGFGHQLALRLDNLGFKVFACCLYPDGAGAKALDEKTSDRVEVLGMDVTKEETIKKAFILVRDHLDNSKDRLWALVNNAGIATVTEIEWCPIEVYRKIFDVNALGLIRVTKMFLPLLRRSEGNRIIIVASLAGRWTFPGFVAYSMSKHAAVSFADGLRIEMRKWNISVHTVEPTLYRTPIAEPKSLRINLDKIWKECPEHIKKSYGTEYLEDFHAVMCDHLTKAKPTEKIREVIDDMIDAIAGQDPKVRYVPSLQTQIRASILSSLPNDVMDNLLCQTQPKTPPADLEGIKRFHFNNPSTQTEKLK